ncbi:MAG: amidohydrolase family protein [Bryobacteraceae bacterium]
MRGLRALAALQADPLDVVATVFIQVQSRVLPARQLTAYLDSVSSQLLPTIRKRRLARFVEVVCGAGGLDPDQARRLLACAADLGFAIKVHTDGLASDQAVALAIETGATSIGGLVELAPDHLRSLAASAVIVTLSPAADLLALGAHPAPARDLIAAGAAVALASGYGAGSPTFSLPVVLSLACSRLGLAPAEAIAAATVNAAWAAGLGPRLGSLEPGKQADLVIFDVPDYREIPYHFGVNLVSAVLKRGELLYRRGDILWNQD